jgi:feruloyl esterase
MELETPMNPWTRPLARHLHVLLWLLAAVVLGTFAHTASAVTLPVTLPVMSCADLAKVDFSKIEGAPTKINLTVVDTPANRPIPTPQCYVGGTAGADVRFDLRLPTENWTGRLVMQGCGGYCGTLITLPSGYGASASQGCPKFASGEVAEAAHNGGHVGQTNGSRFLASISDGAWAADNPGALVNFFYASNHTATLAVKAIIAAFYGTPVKYSYFDGCSSGGRAGLHMAQRYPDDYDGILSGAPTIDNTQTNTFLHAWNVRVNRAADGTSILTADKIPALANAVLAACADSSGMVADPRACHFNPQTLVCPGADNVSCLTPAQARAASLIYQGAVDERGRLLQPGGMPYGSELAWAGSIALAKGVKFSIDTSSEYAFSYDFPNFMSNFHTTGITNENIQFTSEEFARLDTLHGLNDPTNPDLRAFARRGGKLLIWQGWADSGSSPFTTLNYYQAVRKEMGAAATSNFLSLYFIPGVYHCAGGPVAATLDMLTPLMNWVEDNTAPARQVVAYRTDGSSASPITRTRAVFPYPSTSVYNGQGSVNEAANYVQGPATPGVSDVLQWAGLFHYTPSEQLWCRSKDRDATTTLSCTPQRDRSHH